MPNARYGGKPVPGTNQVLVTMAAHHFPPIADIAVVDRSHGLEALEGLHTLNQRLTEGFSEAEVSVIARWLKSLTDIRSATIFIARPEPGALFYEGNY